MSLYYKSARPDGWDWQTGKTINYRENIGNRVICPGYDKGKGLCSSGVVHASKNVLDAVGYGKVPCSIYQVKGTPVLADETKAGFRSFTVLEEIPENEFDVLLRFRYSEVINPVNSLLINQKVSQRDKENLKKWASVWDSVGASVGDSVWASVGVSVWASVWDSVGASVGDSVGASVWVSVRDSVWASVWAYIGSLFPNIREWNYITHEPGVYPFQSAVDLWKRGFIPIRKDEKWHLWTKKDGIVYTME